jgi:hypothetical protein
MDDMTERDSACPGCGLHMPARAGLTTHGYYNASPECWGVYTEVLGAEYSNAVLFGQVHQRTVDTYAVQHAGGVHPDKSVAVHLAGLYLVIERGVKPTDVPARFQQLATNVREWPHFEPPVVEWPLTVFDVAMASTPVEHAELVRQWSAAVWKEWAFARETIARLV